MTARITPFALVVAVLVATPTIAQKSLSPLDMSLGRTEDNHLSGPIYDSSDTAPVTFGKIEWAGEGQPLVRRLKNQKARYTAGPELGDHLSSALRSEAEAMGLRSGDGWKVSGRLDEISQDERRIPYGPLMFYSFLRVTLDVESPAGEKQTRSYDLHNIYWRYNAGFGMRDEAMEALAAFLVESSQELVARLNRDWFGAPPAAAVASRRIDRNMVVERESLVREIGLAGSTEHVATLLGFLDTLRDEDERINVINALALIGDESGADALKRRYPNEKEDARFYTLKALDYIGGSSRRFAEEQGIKDASKGCRRLAERIG